MSKVDYQMEVEGITKRLDALSGLMSEARKREAEAKIDWEGKKQAMDDLATDLIIEIANRDEVRNSIDPRTGKANADWAKLLTQQHLASDPVFTKMAEAVYKSRDVYYVEQSNAQDVADKIGTTRTQAILVSSLLRYMAAVDEDI